MATMTTTTTTTTRMGLVLPRVLPLVVATIAIVSPMMLQLVDAFTQQPFRTTSTLSNSNTINTRTNGNTHGNAHGNAQTALNLRVAYQGEPGAYSEKSTRELLGDNVNAIGFPNFEACFRAVASMEVDYCCLPIENSLGGSIHENYDLMLRYDLTICAEHEFRVQHCVLAKDDVRLPDGKNDDDDDNQDDEPSVARYAISHPQALAQCDNYLRSLGITPIPTYDTAGSAKMIRDNDLPSRCTPENTIAIASDLAGTTYGMNCLAKGVEDDDSNFTRFLLLGRKGVLEYLQNNNGGRGTRTRTVPCKTSVVFTLPNTAGALYKALACFSLRDIDFSKIESRPTSAALLNYLKFRKSQQSTVNDTNNDLPRFRYCFYLDFLDGQLSSNSENALSNLREFTDFVRILGSYPQKSRLVGPVLAAAEEIKIRRLRDETEMATTTATTTALDAQAQATRNNNGNGNDYSSLAIGLVGFGSFGQVLAARMVEDNHRVSCLDTNDKAAEAEKLGVDFHYDATTFFRGLDVVVLSVPLIRLQEAVDSLPINELRGKLVVDVGPLNNRPKAILLEAFANYPDVDVLVTNPLLGMLPREEDQPKDNANDNQDDDATATAVMTPAAPMGMGPTNTGLIWENRQMVYERARVANIPRCDRYLEIFERARCEVVEMETAGDNTNHDSAIGDAQFVTHLIGRLLDRDLLTPSPIVSKEYKDLAKISEIAAAGSFDRFYGMYKYNEHSRDRIRKLRENLASLECELAARGAYLSAKEELIKGDRQRLLSETRMLLQELAKNDFAAANTSTAMDRTTPDIHIDTTSDGTGSNTISSGDGAMEEPTTNEIDDVTLEDNDSSGDEGSTMFFLK